MSTAEILKRLEAIRTMLSPHPHWVKTAKAELENLIQDIARERKEG